MNERRSAPAYPKVTYWAQNYGAAGASDQRAVETYVDCENSENIQTLRNELLGISRGNYRDDIMQKLIGRNRMMQHTTYREWGKKMLLWIANYKRQ
jgi:hypothetical protein